jgi:heme-degrading monooxygenase HmoA
MYARSTRMYADPQAADAAIDFVCEQVWPMVQSMEGCIGMSMIVDRESGLGITTTSWATEEALAASRAPVAPLRDQAMEITGTQARPEISEWEIASMHRAHHADPGTCVSAAWSRIDPSTVEQALEFYRVGLLPQIEQLEGFVSASLMIDRAQGLGVTSVAFESSAAMAATREQAEHMRARSTQEAGVEFLEVGEFELVLAHLHLPELV